MDVSGNEGDTDEVFEAIGLFVVGVVELLLLILIPLDCKFAAIFDNSSLTCCWIAVLIFIKIIIIIIIIIIILISKI